MSHVPMTSPPPHLILLSFALILPSVAQGTTIKYCDRTVDYAVKVRDVGISPNPVEPGKPTTFDIYASSDQALPKGKVVIKVLYHGILLRTETHNICEAMSCPIASGEFTLSHTQNLPAFAPPGLYTLKITMEDDENNQQLTCISFNFRIGFGRFHLLDS
ncbi:hypothetical protein MLD38_040259 [Melastoma candidum]|uniref:Uncharacterized protein n=1 Tax=Melastoma candidum TaxID=119954 RepID=A0ACB9L5L9_9MYRT|nr:hypothetical protein MLD38_040259 [Melastoma candidum]